MLVSVWEVRYDPFEVLKWTTVITLWGFLSLSVYCSASASKAQPTLSAAISDSPAVSLLFAALVYVHGYAIACYLTLASEYIGMHTRQYSLVTATSVAYWCCLIAVSYLPLEEAREEHHMAATGAFVFATLSAILHRRGGTPVMEIYEVGMMSAIVLSGIAFWVAGVVFAEYTFIGLVILDKALRIKILRQEGLVSRAPSYVEYRFYSEQGEYL